MTRHPKSVHKSMLAVDALSLMEENQITQLIVEDSGIYIGIIHLHDILKEGIL